MLSDEERLWRAVLLQAFIDATESLPTPPPGFNAWVEARRERREKRGQPQESEIAELAAWSARRSQDESALVWAEYHIRSARQWLLGREVDFVNVCRMAGCHPDTVRAAAERLRVAGWPAVKPEEVEL